MARKSKWNDVEFSVADFATPYSPDFIHHVIELIRNKAEESMAKNDREILTHAIESLQFSSQRYPFNIAADLAMIAELLWLRNAPSPSLIKSYARRKSVSDDEAKTELVRICARNFHIHFIEAWRTLDHQITEKYFMEARHGLINEVVIQTLLNSPGRDALPLTRNQLYQLAIADEEQLRKRRMGVGRGGSVSTEYNFRWFPHHYSRAYQMLIGAVNTNPETMRSNIERERKKWIKKVKSTFPELDEELIARLTGIAGDLTEEHQVKLSSKGGDNTPHQIALEQAARWCGVKRYLYKQRGLEKRLEGLTQNVDFALRPALHTLLWNWYLKGQELTKEDIKEIIRILKR